MKAWDCRNFISWEDFKEKQYYRFSACPGLGERPARLEKIL